MKDYPAVCLAPVSQGHLALSPAQRKLIAAYLKKREGQDVRLTFSQPTKTRSNQQNRYYWGCVLTFIAAETGHTTEEIHEYCKAAFMPRAFIKLGGHEKRVTKSTTTLSTDEFEEYLDQVRAFAATELSIQIPMPNEV